MQNTVDSFSIFCEQALQILSPTKILPHIPIKGARHAAALEHNRHSWRVISILDDEEMWLELFCFAQDCLSVKSRNRLHVGKKLSTYQAVKGSILAASQQIHSHRSEPKTGCTKNAWFIHTSSTCQLCTGNLPGSIILTRRVSVKINEGDVRGAICLACSSDAVAPWSAETLVLLWAKHPPAPPDHVIPVFNTTSEVPESISLLPPATVRWAVKSFPPNSAGGITALCPQHLKELTSCSVGDAAVKLLEPLVKFAAWSWMVSVLSLCYPFSFVRISQRLQRRVVGSIKLWWTTPCIALLPRL